MNEKLKESMERIRILESKMPQAEKDYKLQISNYQKNFDTLTTMYHSLSTQKKLLSKDMKVVESKL